MDHVLRTPADVIKALGGTSEAARRLGGLSLPQVSNWLHPLRNRIPSELFVAVNAALQPQGKLAAPEVFGMAVPQAGAVINGKHRRKRLGT